eukprot:scaffold2858_cov256-Chaetoceros_neogracile.AAC.9
METYVAELNTPYSQRMESELPFPVAWTPMYTFYYKEATIVFQETLHSKYYKRYLGNKIPYH